MIYEYEIKTQSENFYSITSKVRKAISDSGVTAGITINENADPDVVTDILHGLEQAFPDRESYRHMEGNSHAHLKASAIGSSVTVIIENEAPVLGIWQGIYFCEFDGPRTRRFYVKVIKG